MHKKNYGYKFTFFFQLLSFTDNTFLRRDKISSIIKLMPEEINQIFAELCTQESKKGWRLKEPPNWNFCNR